MVDKDREIVLALVTFPGEEAAAELARRLLAEGLVACVNVVPGVRSLYPWEGAIQDETEVLNMRVQPAEEVCSGLFNPTLEPNLPDGKVTEADAPAGPSEETEPS